MRLPVYTANANDLPDIVDRRGLFQRPACRCIDEAVEVGHSARMVNIEKGGVGTRKPHRLAGVVDAVGPTTRGPWQVTEVGHSAITEEDCMTNVGVGNTGIPHRLTGVVDA